jgi:hypothetical protein
MRKNLWLVPLCAVASLFSFASNAGAQEIGKDYAFGIRDAAAKADDDAYYFYSGEMYRNHAYDHADVLTQYASLNRPVPIAVIEEHTKEIRANLVASDKSYSKLTKDFQNNPAAEKHLALMHEHQKNALAALDKVDAGEKSGKVDAKTLATNAKTVQTELSAAAGEHQRFLQKAGKTAVATKQ